LEVLGETLYIPVPWRGKMLVLKGSIRIKYPHGEVELIGRQYDVFKKILKKRDYPLCPEVEFNILPSFGFTNGVGYILIPDNIFESCPSAEE
jgi:hypothetical protein